MSLCVFWRDCSLNKVQISGPKYYLCFYLEKEMGRSGGGNHLDESLRSVYGRPHGGQYPQHLSRTPRGTVSPRCLYTHDHGVAEKEVDYLVRKIN